MRMRNLENNLGLALQLSEGYRKRMEKTNWFNKEDEKEGEKEKEGDDCVMMIDVGPELILQTMDSVESGECKTAIPSELASL